MSEDDAYATYLKEEMRRASFLRRCVHRPRPSRVAVVPETVSVLVGTAGPPSGTSAS